jgi:hypothetical protein
MQLAAASAYVEAADQDAGGAVASDTATDAVTPIAVSLLHAVENSAAAVAANVAVFATSSSVVDDASHCQQHYLYIP